MYSASQKQLIAREIARSGGILSKAVEALQNEYETFPSISDATLRRLMKRKPFRVLVEKQKAVFAEARLKLDREAAESKSFVDETAKAGFSAMVFSMLKKCNELAQNGNIDAMLQFVRLSEVYARIAPKTQLAADDLDREETIEDL